MSTDKLPDEILLKIFSFLQFTDLLSAGRTCKQWQDCSKDHLLLEGLAKQRDLVQNWSKEGYIPSNDEICLAMSLGTISFVNCFFVVHSKESLFLL